jgi:hypothetical protein
MAVGVPSIAWSDMDPVEIADSNDGPFEGRLDLV